MKEAIFYTKNRDKWKRYEQALAGNAALSPDALADVYIDVSNDLSFAKTHYPHSHLGTYLNGIATRFHHQIYRRRAKRTRGLADFWLREVPLTLYDARRELLAALIIFAVGAIIGAFSSAMDGSFKSSVLGADYVDMTMHNIRSGDPMGVYKRSWAYGMFLSIGINNLRVVLMAFIAGALTSVATGYILLQNGVMIGVFHQMFYEQGLLGDALLAIWMHGSLEVPSIIVAGAAGMAMGNGWLFPGTYRRIDSFRRGARRGMKIVVALVPFIVLAAVFESFLTRYTEIPDVLRACFIATMLSFAVYYFVVLPQQVHRQQQATQNQQAEEAWT